MKPPRTIKPPSLQKPSLNLQKPKPDYRFYATLLDSFLWYQKSEYDSAFNEFIDKLNRVPFTSDAAAKGTAFNDLVDAVVEQVKAGEYAQPLSAFEDIYMEKDGFKFPAATVIEIARRTMWGIKQHFTKGYIETSKGIIELYGYVDDIWLDCATDLKTTKSYDPPKYGGGMQHHVYPFTLNQEGVYIRSFEYLVTDFSNVYVERYDYNEAKSSDRITGVCNELIDFIEKHRELITDRKLFNLEPLPTSVTPSS